MSNPFDFTYYNETNDFEFHTNFGKEHYVDDTEIGKKYLKFTVKYTQRNHDGYCSAYDFEREDINIANSKTHILTFYTKIPEYLCINNEINHNLIDNDSKLISNLETEDLFFDWTEHSLCDGSGCCNLYDSYKPIKIEYIEII